MRTQRSWVFAISPACSGWRRIADNLETLRVAFLKRKWLAMLNPESGDRIELFYEDSPEAAIRATVNRLLSDRDEGMGLV